MRDAPRLRQEEDEPQREEFVSTGFHLTRELESVEEETESRSPQDGSLNVVFAGTVMHYACYEFVCELLKCVLYQRQQLPMPYDEMVVFQNQQLATTQLEEGAVMESITSSGDTMWQHCQRTLQDLDEVLGQLEELFSLSYVPRVLFVLGRSGILPTEMYEINMEALVLKGCDKSLRTSDCLRQVFRTLFSEDFFSDVKPMRLMGTTVMALAHRDCGVGWFKPKVDFRLPTKVNRKVIALASGGCVSGQRKPDARDTDDYIWFQTPIAAAMSLQNQTSPHKSGPLRNFLNVSHLGFAN
ncbi:MAD2L1-binding protein-like [Clarias magur]|uniref:MAD2L1-binding protein-like n=1 Tax=Clarias magur TaxID=1594786 RepID=A0A8J4USF7_CLAMG|nr:MAD2L1-binding protein-like [Clarias magur]